jgi:hypothetical protein
MTPPWICVDIDEVCAYLSETVCVKQGVLGRTVRGSETAVAICAAVDTRFELSRIPGRGMMPDDQVLRRQADRTAVQ